MTTLDSGAPENPRAISRAWGHRPSTLQLISLAAAQAPDGVAVHGAAGPVTFAALDTQAAATAGLLLARGLDAEAAISATIAGLLPTAGRSPVEIASATSRAIADIRAAAAAVAGTDDWESLPGLFASAAHRFADRPAVSDSSGATLTYRELDQRSDAVAAGLVAAGAGEESVVGLAFGRSVDVIVALLGVLKAHAAYLPLDTSNPVERLGFIIDDAQPVLVLADESGRAALAGLDVEIASLDAIGAGAAPSPDRSSVRPATAAYMIYTSGSTGRPKGVVVEHRRVVALMAAIAQCYDLSERDSTTMFHSYQFDVSVFEIFSALLFGGRLVVVDYLTTRSPADFADLLERESVTVVAQTPSAFNQLGVALRADATRHLASSVRYIVLAGEALEMGLARRWYADRAGNPEHGQPLLTNMYGPTEATVYSTFRALTPEFVAATTGSDIGLGLPGVDTYILDARLRPVPEGVPGELYLAGAQLARGYLGRVGLTASTFVADPYGGPGAVMYRTGDMCLRRGDLGAGGGIEYLGRADAQIKLRGFRIELGEVEAALAAAPGVAVAAAAVKVRDDQPPRLVGYVVGVAGAELDVAQVRSAAAARVPEYMVPDVVIEIETLPLNINGKLDRAALPTPLPAVEAEYVEPQGQLETDLAAVMADVLGLDRVGATTSIFDIGGNSLVAAQISARCAESLDLEVSVRDVFEARTVRELAARVGGREHVHRPELVAATRPVPIPLAHAQRRIWFISELDPQTAIYNIPVVLRFRGPLDPVTLSDALHRVVARHEPLRTRFPSADGEPVQEVLAVGAYRADIELTDPSSVTPDDLPDAIASVAGVGFDLAAAPPLRARLFRVAPDDHVFLLVVHHIIGDGASLRPLARDLVAAYSAELDHSDPQWPELSVQYADYALWQHDLLGDTEDPRSIAAQQLAFWQRTLQGAPELLVLPADRPRPPVPSQRAAAHSFTVPAELVAALHDFAHRHNVSLFMTLHAAWVVLLHRLTGDTDIVVGTPYAGRGERALDDLVGMFINTVALRTEIDPAAGFVDLVSRVRDADLAALGNADVPFDLVVERVAPVRSTAHSPIFQVLLLLHQAQSVAFELGGARGELMEVYRDLTDNDLAITFVEAADPSAGPVSSAGLSGIIEYNTDLFDEDRVRSFTDIFVRITAELLADPATAVGDIPVLDAEDFDRRLAGDCGDSVRVADITLADAVAQQISAHPDDVVLIHRDRRVTGAEFGARVASLARTLIAEGVGPDVAVVVCIPRSIEMMIAIHGVVAAGGQYVPVDTDAPAERVEYMLTTAGAEIALVHAGEPIPESLSGTSARVFTIDSTAAIDPDTAPIAAAERISEGRGAHAAYTIFTSGSTGRPKGVTLPHDAVVNRLYWGLDQLPITADDLVVLKTPYTFDCSVAEIFAPLMNGTPLLIADADGHLDPVYMAELMAESGATMAHFVPSMLAVFLELAGPERLSRLDSLRILSTTGEALPPSVAAHARAAIPSARLFNLYGPTEAAVEITYAEIDSAADIVPIGVPVWNSTAHVLDARLHPVPDGVAGELYVGGVQLARGYASRADLTADRFVADPFGRPGTRLYRTGDLVRRNSAGDLEYLGRTDFQVKLRGQRIELGEIEAALTTAPGVVHAAATVITSPVAGEHLVGYVAGEAIDIDEVKAAIAKPLPEFMRPTVWVVLDDVPLNSAGKLDRKALPEPEFSVGEYVAPHTDTERVIAEVMAAVLGFDRVSATDSFFDVGGNSLSATRVVARVSEACEVDLGVRAVFDAPSVRELAAFVDAQGDPVSGGRPVAAPIVAVERPDVLPLSAAQQRMWFINQFDPSSPAYNIPVLFEIDGAVDADLMRRALDDVVGRHEVLRTTYPSDVDGAPYQSIAEHFAGQTDWEVVDIDATSAQAVVAQTLDRGFDVARELPLRVRLIRTGIETSVLVIVVHHVAADGESGPVLARDLIAAYQARVAGTTPSWSPLPLQYADYALWQERALGSADDPDSARSRQLEFWRRALAGVPEVLDLPMDRPRPEAASYRSASIDFAVDGPTRDALVRLADRSSMSLFMVVHAAVASLLARLSGTTDIAVATPVAGRGQAELDDLVGMFVNTLVLRTELAPADTVDATLAGVRDTDLAAFDHAGVPFEQVVEAVDPVRSDSFEPLAQTLLVFVSAPMPAFDVAGLRVTPRDPGADSAKFDLTFGVRDDGPSTGVSGSVVFATDLFDADTAAGFARGFERVLAGLAAVADADPAVAVLADI
ncbi:amino acid adenylation domain-containing protein, partial [Gordonia sp. NPDC003585]|uniref:amino acid adenylation domain-containing protein n=1 Tax=Gordonia sp. NPDC003585 TaxID=3154275 RepID=UPI0033B66733